MDKKELLNKVQQGLKQRLDSMKDNHERSEWLAWSFKQVNLGEEIEEAIIRWFLCCYPERSLNA